MASETGADDSVLPEGYELEKALDVKDAHSKPQRTVQAAVKLRTRGASYPEIAEILGYASPASARVAVEEALAGIYADESDTKALRTMTSLQYRAMMRSLSRKAFSDKLEIDDPDRPGRKKVVENDQHLAYVREMKSVVDSFVRLHGVAAPVVSVLIQPEAEQLENFVREMVVTHRAANDSAEADIFEDEEVEDAVIVDG